MQLAILHKTLMKGEILQNFILVLYSVGKPPKMTKWINKKYSETYIFKMLDFQQTYVLPLTVSF
jgi:hypothetical protein